MDTTISASLSSAPEGELSSLIFLESVVKSNLQMDML